MLLYNDYILTLLGRNRLLPIENKKVLEKNYRQWYKRRQITIQNKGVLAINLHNQGRGKTRSEQNLDWGGVGWCGARDVWAAHKD
jgi:hypothetical protein